MKTVNKQIAVNVLIALSAFILFLLLFLDQIELPDLLQSIGRMHPVLLHFPIVLLLISFVFVCIKKTPGNNTWSAMEEWFLFAGAALAGLTAIMGIFLSKESGYNDEILFIHQWGAIVLFFIAVILYIFNKRFSQKIIAARIFAISGTVVLIISGHYGGELTHGSGYLTGPLTSAQEQKQVAFQDAMIYEDLIRPVFAAKCQGCHNPSKLKGQLSLTDSAMLLKGGKSGRLFVHGSPELSLIMERIHLPESDKKHMPPAGKTQLSRAEEDLINAWIKDSARFNVKIASYPEEDSLRKMAIAFLPVRKEEKFDFAATDESKMEKLNNDFRKVRPIAANSPALAVNFFNNRGWSAKSIEELVGVKQQIVSMELHKVPVTNDDLKHIAGFVNLRRLNLNFTQITAEGLVHLLPLEHLQSLSLTGTKMEMESLQRYLNAAKSLNQLAFWNSGLSKENIRSLVAANKHIRINAGNEEEDQMMLQLNKVQLKNSSSVFSETAFLQLKHPIPGVDIRYTLDGKDPDSIVSPVYNGKDKVDKSVLIKARAYKSGWISGDITEFRLYKSRYKPDAVQLITAVHERFPALGTESFFDGKIGGYSQYGDRWVGFSAFPMELLLLLNDTVNLRSVTINYLSNPPAGFFPPGSLEIWGGEDVQHLKLVRKKNLPVTSKDEKLNISSAEINFDRQKLKWIKIIAHPQTFPSWHKAKGKLSVLLIDEVLLN
ncbi:c-type cytochrome domain-containing protein [Pollutibacter soli]|uniref:c-type cytochrome domain-containing protein n=1 Tax=Pollutibacter soli TaxID=3034157 RepID=UPI003013632D